ncbi:glycerophosphodiester phosphodiesterase [Janthinobacterium fluminis]|uniref:Glycerophosphodiester phosphodiesterase n=1 Tax=Janthinobacterium fluminis TaxID=2987524 RepID=A0ABT5JXU6_9BURK|nr:glycerophosphodiester phosphodiesterase [Janthinobacterium fluminis]MDC8757394.1 glycerophosphodiester phosphodiesterase [Janthinobacterium fluminis]
MWPYPKIVAHRGGGTLAPENTFAALRCGLDYGFRAVEFDVMLSRDGVGVVLHDDQLGRTVAGSGSVAERTAAELTALDAGSWFSPLFADERVPDFGQFMAYCKARRIWMNIEIKPVPGHERATGRAVAAAVRAGFGAEIAAGDPAQLPLLSSFSAAALAAARDAAPQLPRAYLLDALPADWRAQSAALGAVAVHTNHRHLTPALARAVKDAGLGLFCYTVNEPERARTLLGWGVDGFCTDRIDLIGPAFA